MISSSHLIFPVTVSTLSFMNRKAKIQPFNGPDTNQSPQMYFFLLTDGFIFLLKKIKHPYENGSCQKVVVVPREAHPLG